MHIAANKNTVPGDVSAMVPGGIRMGKFIISKTCIHKRTYAFLKFDILIFKNEISFCSNGLGTPALTSRGFLEEDFVKVAELFDASVKLALKIKAASAG